MAFRFFGPRPTIGTNGTGSPPRSYAGSTPRERELEAEVRALRAEQARLVRAEEEARNNLSTIQDSLDVLAGEIDRRAKAVRDPELRQRGERMIARAKRIVAERGGRHITPAVVVDLVKAFVGLEKRSGWIKVFLEESAAKSSRRPPEAVQASAQGIVDAGNAARGQRDSIDIRTGRPKPLPSSLASIDPTARDIVRAGRRARNQPNDE
jgi:hypothetical protein